MGTHRRLSWSLPATPRDILRTLATPEAAAARAVSDPSMPGEVIHVSGHEDTQTAVTTTISAELPTSWVPPHIASQLSAAPRVTRREEWRLRQDGGAEAAVHVTLERVPATSLDVTGSLTPLGAAGSRLSYDFNLHVRIPVMGIAIEQAIMAQLVRAYEREAVTIVRLLAPPWPRNGWD